MNLVGRALLSGLATLALLASVPATARDLTVTSFGGSSQAAQRKIYYEPFAAQAGIRLLEDSWSGGIGVLRTKVQGGNASWDVVQVEVDELHLGCAEGLFEKLDWQALGGRAAFLPEAADDCGVGAIVWSIGMVYDGQRFPEGPRSWADFWDMDRFPGKRSMRRGAKNTLEFALMADGVPAGDVYKVLRTPQGVDRAFRKLDEIKPQIIWWTAGSQPPQLLASGEIAMAASYFGRIQAAARSEKRDFRVVWPGSIYAVDYWVILKGSPNRAAAQSLITFMTRPERQRQFPPFAFHGVTNLEAGRRIDPELAPQLPSHPANIAVALPVDVAFWVDNIDQLNQRFNAWAGR